MRILVACAALSLGACAMNSGAAGGGERASRVETTGKLATPLAEVPPEVIAAARAAQPELQIASAEAETRDGRRYFDLGGTMPDGSEVELDIIEEGGLWRVVETQRDLDFAAVPEPVRLTVQQADPDIVPSRVIESRQEDGVVIYEIYSPERGDPQGRKLEVRWDGSRASVLAEEWAH